MPKFKCKHCKEYFDKSQLFKVPAGSFCSQDHAVAFAIAVANKNKEKARKKQKVIERKKLRVRKQALKTVSELSKEVQSVFNKFIRLRDAGKKCISCPADLKNNFFTGSNIHAGHYRSVGSSKQLRFDEDNVHGQCAKCNVHLSGNQINMRKGMVKRIGEKRVEQLDNNREVKRWTKEELAEKLAHYKAKVKELESLSE